jgi:hypothetical protein
MEDKSKPKISKGQIFDLFDLVLMFNIIITNKNNTAIAPTYTINNKKAKNSAPNKIKIPITLQKTVIKNNIECTALAKLITMIAEIKAKLENK